MSSQAGVPSKRSREASNNCDGKPALRTLYFGIDVEKLGPRQNDTLLAVGLAVADTERGVIDAKRWCFPGPYVVEELCMTEFWSKHPKLLVDLIAQGCKTSAAEQFRDIRRWLTKYETETLEIDETSTYNGRCSIGSDNPAFDLGAIDPAWERVEGNHVPLHYTRCGMYRDAWDSSERIDAMGLDRKLIKKFLASINVRNDHNPENDATKHIWELFITMAYAAFLRDPANPLLGSGGTWESVLNGDHARYTVLMLARQQELHMQGR